MHGYTDHILQVGKWSVQYLVCARNTAVVTLEDDYPGIRHLGGGQPRSTPHAPRSATSCSVRTNVVFRGMTGPHYSPAGIEFCPVATLPFSPIHSVERSRNVFADSQSSPHHVQDGPPKNSYLYLVLCQIICPLHSHAAPCTPPPASRSILDNDDSQE